MSRNSDVEKLLDLARARGLGVVKSKHGGYRIERGGEVVAYVGGSRPGNGTWVRSARRKIERAASQRLDDAA